jgi:hypothetical protein
MTEVVVQCRACDGTGLIDSEKCEKCDGTGYVLYLEPRSIFHMTPEERKAIMDANPPEITSIHYGGVYLDWSWMGCGFGQLSFEIDRKTGAITFMDEHMGKGRVRTILHQLVDHLVENGKFDERD